MSRAVLVVLFAIPMACTLPPEKPPLKPLPEDLAPQAYRDLLGRARVQATGATEAFFVNAWGDLEEWARGLEQTARFLGKATDIPLRHQAKLKDEVAALEAATRRLQDAAKTKDEKLTNECLQQINLLVRELRVDG